MPEKWAPLLNVLSPSIRRDSSTATAHTLVKTVTHSILALGCLATTLALPALGQALVKNPSFENSIATTWPFYGPIDDWQGGSGVNEGGGPFHNSGTPVPDGRRIGFKQGSGAIAQEISDLVPGKRYWIQFRYDTRRGSDLDLEVKFSTTAQGGSLDETLETLFKPNPAITTGLPYYSRTVPFTPDATGGTLSFNVVARGDSTALIDGVTIVQRNEGEFAVMNPSFEASGVVFDGAPSAGTDWAAINGWTKTGVAGVDDGTGGQANNGSIPEQALVAFIADEGSLAQTLAPLVANETYQLSFAYNAKSGSSPHLQVLVGNTVVWEKDVTAVGGVSAYARQTVSFKASANTEQITFKNTKAGATVLLDDVHVVGKTGTSLPPFEILPVKMAMRVGQESTGTFRIPNERLALGPTTIKLRSSNPNVFIFPGADSSGTLTLTFNGTTTQPYTVRGVAVGNAAIEISDPAGLPFPPDLTSVFVAGTTFVLNPSFELDKDGGVGPVAISGWTTSGANIGIAQAGNPFLSAEDLSIPDRFKVLRIQGGGGSISQTIRGLTPGQLYGLQFFYNGRNSGFPYELSLQVNFAGKELANIQKLKPANQDGLTEYHFREVRFTPTEATGLLEFKTSVAAGDATLFLDAISIVPRIANEIAVKNSSFEGTATGANWPGYLQPQLVAGWLAAGGGYGVNAYSPKTFFVEPFLDNGINSDQDNAFFGQGAVNIKQTVSGLTAGQAYTLVFDYNFRDGRGQNSNANPNTGQIDVSIDGNSVFTSEDVLPVDSITPYPGFHHTKPFYQAFVPFTAGADAVEILIAHIGLNGDETFLVDNVRILPGSRTAPAISKELVDQTVKEGATATFTVAAPGANLSYRWYQDGVPLTDGGSISGSSSPTLTISKALLGSAGTYSALVSNGVGIVGSTAVLTVEPAPIQDVALSISLSPANKLALRWPAAATGYRLQRAASLPTAANSWSDEPTSPIQNGTNWEVLLDLSSSQQYYRLVQ